MVTYISMWDGFQLLIKIPKLRSLEVAVCVWGRQLSAWYSQCSLEDSSAHPKGDNYIWSTKLNPIPNQLNLVVKIYDLERVYTFLHLWIHTHRNVESSHSFLLVSHDHWGHHFTLFIEWALSHTYKYFWPFFRVIPIPLQSLICLSLPTITGLWPCTPLQDTHPPTGAVLQETHPALE